MQYGHILHDVLPFVLHTAKEQPAAKIAVQLDPDSAVKNFMEWFLPPLLDRLLFVCVDKDLLLLQPSSAEINGPEELRISEVMTPLHQSLSRQLGILFENGKE
eukprot:Skav201472  [mRNA]  locus=scaffold828:9023:9749:- [translate_table: standard]